MGEYLESWLAANRPPTLSPTTWKGYADIVRNRVAPRIGGVRLQALTPQLLQQLYAGLRDGGGRGGRGLSPQSVKNTYSFLNRALSDAVRLRLIRENPNEPVARPKVPRAESSVWSPKEVAAFLAGTRDDPLWPAWVLLLSTGMRRGELLGLRWSDVDLDGARVRVQRNVVAAGYDVHDKDPKTTGSRRAVALDAAIVEALRVHRRRIEADAELVGRTVQRDEPLFLLSTGERLHPQSLSYRFEKAARQAGVRPISMKDARHTSATLALLANTHAKVVSERLGHSDIQITMDTYTHVPEEAQRRAAENIGALLWAPTSPLSRSDGGAEAGGLPTHVGPVLSPPPAGGARSGPNKGTGTRSGTRSGT